METYNLAQDLAVSRLGFGGCPLGGHGWGGDFRQKEGLDAVRLAWDRGVTFFDTADVYGLGKSERLLSRALGKNRHAAIIATKFGVCWDSAGKTWKDISIPHLRKALEASLRRLRLDCIPLYYVHWPDSNTSVEDVIGELRRCRDEGKIRGIGVSNFSAEQLATACQVARVSAIQLQYSLVDREHVESVLPIARKYGVPLVTWGSLAQGLLTGKYGAKDQFSKDDRRCRYENFRGQKHHDNLKVVEVLRGVASRLGKTPAQVAMRWLLDSPYVASVLFGAKRPLQVEDNVGASDWRLDKESYRLLKISMEKSSRKAA